MSPGERQQLSRRLAALSPAQRRLFEQLQQAQRAGAAAATAAPALAKGAEPPPIPRRPPAAAYPLSFGQRRLWLLDRINPGSPAYNLPFAGTLQGSLDMPALRAGLGALVERHEALRTCFLVPVPEEAEEEAEPVQVIAPTAALELPWIDLSALPPPRRQAELDRLADDEGQRPFDLARCPLLRATLIGLDRREHSLLLTLPHIVTDAGSMAVIARDLQAFYEAGLAGLPPAAARLPELPVQAADFAVWQRGRLCGAALDGLLEHWRRSLDGVPTLLDLPADRPRPPVRSGAGARLELAVPPRLAEELRLIGALKGVTPFMLLLAAFGALLGRYTGQDDFLVGGPFAGRTRETEEVVGFFVNTLALRLDLRGDPAFADLLGRVRETCLRAYAHRELPFDRLARALRGGDDGAGELPGGPSLVQAVLLVQNAPPQPQPLPGLSWSRFRLTDTHTAKVDLLAGFWQPGAPAQAGQPPSSRGGLEAWIEYDTDLFDAATIHRLAGHLLQLLGGIVAAPGVRVSELPLLSESERRRLLQEWNATDRPYPQKLAVHELFEAWAERSPEAVAVADGRATLTYGELDRRASRLARRLRRLGVGPEEVVGLVADRSLGMVVGLLAVLKAGGAYLPLDASYPTERLRFMLEDSGARVLLVPGPAAEAVAGHLRSAAAGALCLVRVDGGDGGGGGGGGGPGEDGTAGPPSTGPSPSHWACHLAYVVYTSGSTGRPKGVAVEHRGLPNLVLEQVQMLEVGPEDRVLQLASPSFDACVWEVWMALATGARLCLARPEDLAGGAALVRLLREREITHLTIPPSVLATAGELPPEALPSLRVICVAGEPCPAGLARRWSGPGRRLLNGYGLTETTVCATLADLRPSDRVPPVGRPLANVRAYALDRRLEPVPVGVPGEVHLAGIGLARGYLGLPVLNAERFLPDPFAGPGGAGGRLLRTGDVGRFRPDGQLELLGRSDAQIKVRGVRIEPAEIEAALLAHPGVLAAAVAVVTAGAAGARLAAFLIPLPRPEGSEPPETPERADLRPAALRAFLAERLPEPMLPAVFVQLAALPRTPGGKVDRAALARLAPAPGAPGAYAAPRHGLEDELARLWAEVLGVERVGIDQSFFALGGDSLLGFQVAARAGERGIHFAPRQLFESPTVAALASVVRFDNNEMTALADPFRPAGALEHREGT